MRLSAIMSALCAILIGGIAIVWATQPVPQPAAYLAVEDKPYVEMAQAAQEEAEAGMETYQDEPSYDVETYYEPICYGNSYWYESDDAEAEAAAKEWIAQRESGGDYNATNGRYIGRYQLDSSYLDGDYSEENQEAAASRYIEDRYGSWQAAQEHHREYGWY